MKALKSKHITSLVLSIIICAPSLQAGQTKEFISVQSRIYSNVNTAYFNKTQTKEETETLLALYQLNSHQLLWFNVESPITRINQLLTVFNKAKEQGLNPADYNIKKLNSQWLKLLRSNPSFVEFSDFDQILSLTFIRYLNDLHYGRIDPKSIGYHLPKKQFNNLAKPIFNALQSNEIDTLISNREPNNDTYKKLKIALKKYNKLNSLWNSPLKFGFEKSLRPGDWSTQVSSLRSYLNILQSTPTTSSKISTPPDNNYIGEIVNKIRILQKNYNLVNDGIIGKQTLSILNTPLSHRIKQIELSMERIRWLPEQQEGPNIFVNIPAFRLWANNPQLEDDNLNMKVIVGKTTKRVKDKKKYTTPEQIEAEAKSLQTPVFTADLSFLVFNPYWNIPKNILKKEVLPQLEKKPDYLEQHNMEIVPHFSHRAEILPNNEENISLLYTEQLRLRQRPGNKNSLGDIKFIFPNNYAIYLHDTPFKSLFRHTKRDFSHGCIRVESPQALAKFILKNRKNWNKDKTKSILKTKEPTIVGVLSSKIPVIIFYTTVLPNETDVSFYPDIYGLDKTLIAALTARSQTITIN